jgi:hypothetical protein
MMITIIWSLIDFQVVDVLPKGSRFNAHHYISAIPQSLADSGVSEVGPTDPKLII